MCGVVGAEEASSVLSEQEEGRKESHQKIVGDIDTVKQNIDQVWQRVGKHWLRILGPAIFFLYREVVLG